MRFSSLLVANRGEIACRILRTARAMGLRTVAVWSDADRDAPHVALADAAVRLGPAPAAESYLAAPKLLAAARATGAEAVHPGYGFLSENADFAEAVLAAGLVWVGPPPDAMRAMADKGQAKRMAAAAGVPVLPGHEGEDMSDAALLAAAQALGLPLMVKARAGGGGRGMRLVTRAPELAPALALARAEAEAAFGDGRLLLERALPGARHVEVQVMADRHGACRALGERDCSVQRRHQKLVEEAPAPGLAAETRAAMAAAAVRAARSVGYVGAGTVEFLVGPEGDFRFIEMNTRLQVEHPVTEAVTGLDLVALQLRIAQGEPLGFGPEEVRIRGHAIEARLCAEDPARDFRGATGQVRRWRPPGGEGIRVDHGLAEGMEVTEHYDSLLAKIVAHGATRAEALARLRAALDRTVLLGPATNAGLLAALLDHPAFAEGGAGTDLLARAFPGGWRAPEPPALVLAAAAALALEADRDAALADAGGLAPVLLGWCSAEPLPCPVTLLAGDTRHDLAAIARPGGWTVLGAGAARELRILRDAGGAVTGVEAEGTRLALAALAEPDGPVEIALGADRWRFARPRHGAGAAAADGRAGRVAAPMAGLLAALDAAPGAVVAAGDRLAVIEAMKMQHPVLAPAAGRVAALHAAAGDRLAAGDPLLDLEPLAETGDG